MDLKVGDKMFCDFPDPSAAEGTKLSEKNSGIYIIAELCHNHSQGVVFKIHTNQTHSEGKKWKNQSKSY